MADGGVVSMGAGIHQLSIMYSSLRSEDQHGFGYCMHGKTHQHIWSG